MLAGVGGASVTLVALAVGQSIGGWTRRTALFAPRGLSATGAFPVNRTAASIGLTDSDVGEGYRLTLIGTRTVTLTREQVLALPQYTAELPIACVEGWSCNAASWTGVRLTDLARLAGMAAPGIAQVESIQPKGSFRAAALSAAQVSDPQSLLALRVNGADLPRDHGYPARTIIPTTCRACITPSGSIGSLSWRARDCRDRLVRRWYGAHPLHLLALLAAFALAGYAVHAVVVAGQWRGFAVWFWS